MQRWAGSTHLSQCSDLRGVSCVFAPSIFQSERMSCPSPCQAGTHVSISANLINRLCMSKEFLPTSFYVCREVHSSDGLIQISSD